jgi:hypothetical protein
MRYLLDAALVFLTLGLTEAVIKPLAKRFVQRRLLAAAPAILREVDRRLPELLTLPTGEALEARVRELAEQATGESWTDDDLGPLFELFDLRRAVRAES